MDSLLLAAHVLAGILFVGPVAVTASLFPRFAPLAAPAGPSPSVSAAPPVRGAPAASSRVATLPRSARRRSERSPAVARALYRVTRTYGVLALVVPLIGLVLAAVQGRLGEIWITLAMVLTAVAGGLLALRIVPLQKEAIDAPDEGMRLRTLGALTGVFNLLWATVVVLMIVRPGAS